MTAKRIAFVWALALSGVAMVAVVAAPPAVAKKARRGSRKPKKRAPAKPTAAEQAKAEEAQEKAEERQAPAQLQWRATDDSSDMDARADAKRDEAILKLKEIMPTFPEGPQKAELTFRLSEMYWGKSKFKHLRAMQTWDQALEDWHAKGQQGAEPKLEQVAEMAESVRYKAEALKLYEHILSKYPQYPRKDEVLYNLGSSLYDAGQKKEGVKRYWELIKQYPDSDFAADAWLELGEHFFNSNKVNNAVKAYQKAAETKKPRIYSFALYKLAWCDYNLGEYAAALDKFRQVAEYAKQQKAAGKDSMGKGGSIQLFEESLNDMVRAYSHLDEVEGAFEYYTAQVGPENAYKYMYKLGKLYDKEGKYATEVRTFEELNNRYPYHEKAPENQTAIMNAYAQANKPDQVRGAVRRLIDLYSPDGVWARKNATNERVLTKAFDIVEEQLAVLVSEKHREAQETKLAETYMLARDIYKEYLDKFNEGTNAYEFRFFYAQILNELKDFENAAVQYDRVVDDKADGKFVKHAAYSAVLAWEKVAAGVKETVGKKITEEKKGKQQGALKELEKLKVLAKGKTYEATELKEAEQKLADACDRFVRVDPKADEAVRVKFKAGQLYYAHNQFEPAAERFGVIIETWPKDKLAAVAAELIVQSFNVREDWTNLNVWARKFRDHKLLMANKDFAKRIHEFVEGASFNEIHFVFEPKDSPVQIADRYLAFVKEFPASKFALVGLYNSVVNYDEANLLERSIATAEMVLKDYKSFKIKAEDIEESKRGGTALPDPADIREKTMFLKASFHERIAEFDTAADLYEAYAAEFSKGPKRADALFNAGLFREGLGEYDAAMKNFNAYIKDFSGKPDVPQISWRIGLILEKKGDHAAVAKHFTDYARASRQDAAQRLCADYKVILALEKMQKTKEAHAGYDAVLKDYAKLSPEDRTKDCPLLAAGAASFEKLEAAYQAYLAIPLAGVSEKIMAKNLVAKLEQVQTLQQAYTQVLQLGQGDFGIASLYRIGVIYQHLAQAIFDTQCPKRLDEDQCMIYQAALQEKAFPLEEKAIEAFDKALAKAYELGLYNEWLAKAQDALKTYDPGRFPEIHEYELIASEVTAEPPALVELSQ